MTCVSSSALSQWINPVPISFTEWKSVLSKWTTTNSAKISISPPDPHRQTTSPGKKQERTSLPRNQVFGETMLDTFLVSPSSDILQLPNGLSRQGKRYASSFKTLNNATNSKSPQRMNYINDSVLIFKLSKDDIPENNDNGSPVSTKYSSLSMASAVSLKSAKVPPSASQSFLFPPRLSPILKVEGQKRRIVHHDSSVIASGTVDITIASSSTTHMSTSTSNYPQSNSSLFSYRSAAGGNANRPRAIADTTPNSLLIPTEKLKSNMSLPLRPTRQPLTTLVSSQQAQRPNCTNSKSRALQDKSTSSRDTYEYPDPFTNCPQDVLSKLAQLTKLQLETIEWEKKKRFTKRKPATNGTIHGKDSP